MADFNELLQAALKAGGKLPPIDELIYQGTRQQWGYTLNHLMDRIGTGTPLGAIRSSLSNIPFVPSREFPARAAVGQRVLPAFRKPPGEVPEITQQRLVDMMQNAPIEEREAYHKFAERVSSLPESYLGVHREGPNRYQPPGPGQYERGMNYAMERYSSPAGPEGYVPGITSFSTAGVAPEEASATLHGLLSTPTRPMEVPRLGLTLVHQRGNFSNAARSAAYQEMVRSLRGGTETLAGVTGRGMTPGKMFREYVQPAIEAMGTGKMPSQDVKQFIETIMRAAPRWGEEAPFFREESGKGARDRTVEERLQWAFDVLKGLNGSTGEQAHSLLRLLMASHGKQGLDLWRMGEGNPGTAQIKRLVDVLDQRLAKHMQEQLNEPTTVREWKQTPTVRKAFLMSAADQAFGTGTGELLPEMAKWMQEGQGKGAQAARMWTWATAGETPDSPERIMQLLGGSAARLAEESSPRFVQQALTTKFPKVPRLRGTGFAILQGLGGLMLDDMAREATSALKTATHEALYKRLGRTLLSSRAAGTAAKVALPIAAIAAFTQIPNLMPHAEASPGSEIGKAIEEGANVAASHGAQVLGADNTDKQLAQAMQGGATHLWDGAQRLWGFAMSAIGKSIRTSTDSLRTSLPPSLWGPLDQHTDEVLQGITSQQMLELGMTNQGMTRLQEIDHEASQAVPGLSQAERWNQIHQMLETGIDPANLRRRPGIDERLIPSAVRVRDLANWIYDSAKSTGDPELRPYRIGWTPIVMDPKKLKAFLSDRPRLDAWAERVAKQRAEQLATMYRSPGGISRFWSEIGNYLTADEVKDFRSQVSLPQGDLPPDVMQAKIASMQHALQNQRLFTAIAVREVSKTIAQFRMATRLGAASDMMHDMVVGDGMIPVSMRPMGDLFRPLPNSPYLLNARNFDLHMLAYDNPLNSWSVYLRNASRHVAATQVFGPRGSKLEPFRQSLSEAVRMTTDQAQGRHLWNAWTNLFNRLWGPRPNDFISKLANITIPLSVVSRMTLTAIPHLFQTLNAAALHSWGSYTKSLLEISNGSMQDALRLSDLAGALHQMSWAIEGAQPTDLNGAARKWLDLIGFNPVRRLLVAHASLTAHNELIPRLKLLAQNPTEAKVAEFKKYLTRIGFDRKPTLADAGKMADDLIAEMRKGTITEDLRGTLERRLGVMPAKTVQDPYLKFINAAVDSTAFNFRPWDFPGMWSTPLGRVVFLFRRYFYEQWNSMYRTAINDAKEGNLIPLLTLVGPQAAGAGFVLGGMRHYLNGTPAPWDNAREKPTVIAGVTLPPAFQTAIRAESEGGWFGMAGDIYRLAADPNQPFLGPLGVIAGFLPTELARLGLAGAAAIHATVTGGFDRQRTSDYSAARALLRQVATLVPYVGRRLSDLPVMKTGRAQYLETRKQAILAASAGDEQAYAEYNQRLQVEWGKPITDAELPILLLQQQRRQMGLPIRRPLPGQPGYKPNTPTAYDWYVPQP